MEIVSWSYLLMGIGLILTGGLFAIFVLGAIGATAKWSRLTWFILLCFMFGLLTVGVFSVGYGLGADYSF